jgi:hypothetical protein|eukprot:COSAG06_NODE_5590_length_3379_cov_1.642378_2_plen_77_part_00
MHGRSSSGRRGGRLGIVPAALLVVLASPASRADDGDLAGVEVAIAEDIVCDMCGHLAVSAGPRLLPSRRSRAAVRR